MTLDEISGEKSEKPNELSKNDIVKENLEKSAKSVVDKMSEEEEKISILCKSFDKIYDDSDCNIQ